MYNHYLKIFAASSNYNYPMKYSLRHGKANFQTALEQMGVYLHSQLVWLPCRHRAEYDCVQCNTASTKQEHNLMHFAQGFLQKPQGQWDCTKAAGEVHSRICSMLSVPKTCNPAVFTLQFTFCLCTWVSFQPASAKGEREEWCTPESCSDLQPAHNWTWKGHLGYITSKEFGIPNAM